MNEDRIEINGVAYVRETIEPDCRMRLIIADNRGLTFVGRCSLDGDSEWISIRDARCVIVWGTDQHLAQLAESPRSNTRLGAMRDVRVRRSNIVAVYDCGEGWNV